MVEEDGVVMRGLAIIGFVTFAPLPLAAQSSLPWMPALVMQHESHGGQNDPNFRYDSKHTAGGIFQIVDTTWRRVAPTVDIDIEKFPNAGSASDHQQKQVAWKLWATEGYWPWTCCNPPLRKVLRSIERAESVGPAEAGERHPPQASGGRGADRKEWPNPFLAPAPSPAEMIFPLKEARK